MQTQDYSDLIKTTVLEKLPSQEFEVFLFGSRATGTNKQWSDFDVGVLGKNEQTIPSTARYEIETELDRLNVPFIVDLVDFSLVEDRFKKVAMQNKVLWTK